MIIFDETDRITRPRLTVVEIAAIANTIARERIRKERDVTVRATAVIPKLVDMTPGGAGDIDHDTLVDRPVIATNTSLTGVKYDGRDTDFPPTIVISNDGTVVTSFSHSLSP